MGSIISNTGTPLLIRAGEVLWLKSTDSSKPYSYLSQNAYVASVLQNGKIIANSVGFTAISVLQDGNKIAELFIDVIPGEATVPVLFNRYNRVVTPAGKLVKLDSAYTAKEKCIYIAEEAENAFREMCDKAAGQNVCIYANYGYRSVSDQFKIVNKYIKDEGKEAALKRCAPPCYSEHHTGLAIDVCGGEMQEGKLIERRQAVYTWIEENCYEYGFMIKNLPGREHITGTIYEPWHIRYVGDKAVARVLYDENLTLDEYIDQFAQVNYQITLEELDEFILKQKAKFEAETKPETRPETEPETKSETEPETKPETEPETKSETEPESNAAPTVSITLLAAGDVVLQETQLAERADFSNYFKHINQHLSSADMSLLGIAPDAGVRDKQRMNGNIRRLSEAAANAGFTAAVMANDYSNRCSNIDAISMMDAASSANLLVSGIRTPGAPYLMHTVNGINVAILNYTVAEKSNSCVASIAIDKLEEDLLRLESDIIKARNDHAGVVVLYFHWGSRENQTSDVIQKYISLRAASMGADIIIGTGAGVVQEYRGLKLVNEGAEKTIPVFYGLGDFLPPDPDSCPNHVRSSVMARFTIKVDAFSGRLCSVSCDNIPLYASLQDNVIEIHDVNDAPDPVAKMKRKVKKALNTAAPEKLYPQVAAVDRGEILDLIGTVIPQGRYTKFESSDASVASVTQRGVLIGNSAGYAGITAINSSNERISFVLRVMNQGEGKLPVLVNINNRVRDGYRPSGMVTGEKYFLYDGILLRPEAAEAWRRMLECARAENVYLKCVTGYRTTDMQRRRIQKYAGKYGEENAKKRYMPAGCSEHHLGLALDICGGKTPEGETSTADAIQWVWANADRFNFIARKSKLDVNQLAYVHVRYIPSDFEIKDVSSATELVEKTIEAYR